VAEPIDTQLIDPDAMKVIRRLTRHGHRAYLVGGGVRDLLLEHSPKDFDVATSARPREVRALFRNCRVIGRRFRLAHILFSEGKIIEVATFRRDPGEDVDDEMVEESLDRPPRDSDVLIRRDNAFGEPHEDARRRDFTINGLFYDVEREEVIDFVGGMDDISNRTMRTIGPAGLRFREDPVRMLRALRFAARLDFGLDPELYDAISSTREELLRTAKPRLLEEMLRLLRGNCSRRAVFLAWDTGILSVILPELSHFLDDDAEDSAYLWRRLAALDKLAQSKSPTDDALLLSALLLGPIEEALQGAPRRAEAFEEFFAPIANRFAMPRRIKERARALCLVQKRIQTGKVGNIHRELRKDAHLLFTINKQARELETPEQG